MLLALTLIAALQSHNMGMSYLYTNADETLVVYVSQHFFESLVHEHWCVKVYVLHDGTRDIHVCKI